MILAIFEFRRWALTNLFLAGMLVLSTAALCQEDYPTRPIRIVTAPAGGGNDVAARLIAQGIAGPLGQPVIIDNRPTALYGEVVAKAIPDGYTMLLSGNGLWLSPFMQANVPYDLVRDFSTITVAAKSPNILVVHISVPANSVKELIALAKAKPGELNYASGPAGSANHLAAELFKSMAGVNITRIGYKGGGPALNDLLGGQVQLMFANAPTVAPHFKSGKLRALAVTTAQPSAGFPKLPTLAASGLSGYAAEQTVAILAPAKTPAMIIVRLNKEIVRVLGEQDVREKFFNAGIEPVGNSPQQAAATIKSEMARMGKVIKDAGIRAD